MQIKELAQAVGEDVETIRHHEKQGMLPEPARRNNGYHDYAEEHLERLSFIRHYRALDMPLADVNRLLSFTDAPSADCSESLVIWIAWLIGIDRSTLGVKGKSGILKCVASRQAFRI